MAERPKDLIYARDEKLPAVPLITIAFQHDYVTNPAAIRYQFFLRGQLHVIIVYRDGRFSRHSHLPLLL